MEILLALERCFSIIIHIPDERKPKEQFFDGVKDQWAFLWKTLKSRGYP